MKGIQNEYSPTKPPNSAPNTALTSTVSTIASGSAPIVSREVAKTSSDEKRRMTAVAEASSVTVG
jgi:hypothetical protein